MGWIYLLSFLSVFSMKQLRDRVTKLKEDYDNIYTLIRTEGRPTINWGNMIDEKMVWSSRISMSVTDLTVCMHFQMITITSWWFWLILNVEEVKLIRKYCTSWNKYLNVLNICWMCFKDNTFHDHCFYLKAVSHQCSVKSCVKGSTL